MKLNRHLPLFLTNELNNPPRAGTGVNSWLFKTARQLHIHFSPHECVELLTQATLDCGRFVNQREIERAVLNSRSCAYGQHRVHLGEFLPTRPLGSHSHRKWPSVDERERDAVIRHYGGLAELRNLSNPRLSENEIHTEWIVDRLFPNNPLLCGGWSSYNFATNYREDWRGQLENLQFIVPSEMAAVTGKTLEGKTSSHCLDNTGPRKYLVVEFDILGPCGSQDAQAAILLHLAQAAPLVLVVHSGSKSLHGWFHVQEKNPEMIHKFFSSAVELGADPATWTRSQFVRMPDGRRDNGKLQTIFFVEEDLLKVF